MFLQNHKHKNFINSGTSLIEVIIALFMVSVLSLGLISISNFLNIKNHISQFAIINKSFNEIKQIIKTECGLNVTSDFVNDEIPIFKIELGGSPVYVSQKDSDFNSQEHALSSDITVNTDGHVQKFEDVIIQSMKIKRKNKKYTFEISYLYGSSLNLTETKTFPLPLDVKGDKVISCSASFCPAQIIVPTKDDFLNFEDDQNACQKHVDNTIKSFKETGTTIEKKVKHYRDTNSSYHDDKNLQKVPMHFYVPKSPAFAVNNNKSSFRRVTKREFTTDPLVKCMCLGIFTCYKGYWSNAIKCMLYEGFTGP